MIKSMTGYGRGEASNLSKSIEIEFKSVNSRYFDANIRMPKSLLVLEERIRKTIKNRISRGKIDLFITYTNIGEDSKEIIVNDALANKYIQGLREISKIEGVSQTIELELLTKLEGVVTIVEAKDDPEEIYNLILEALNMALDSHDKMRTIEGQNLKNDILNNRNKIKEKVDIISTFSKDLVPIYKTKIEERIKELDLKIDVDDRLAMEIALYADRAAIDEEITRLYSHLNQLEEILDLNEAVGKKLDFLAQELNREANTIASKSQSIEITKHVLDIKNEIEKIREQIQNIE